MTIKRTIDIRLVGNRESSQRGPLDPGMFDRYLRVLKVQREKPSVEHLNRLVSAHLCRIPFENISKLYYFAELGMRRIPSLDQYLFGIEHYNFGGTCYSNNYYLFRLLEHLGYNVKLCSADMPHSGPDVHMVAIVMVEEIEYLVDVGFAAPFHEALPRDRSVDHVIAVGRFRYVLRPRDTVGRSELIYYRDGERLHGYEVKPMSRTLEFFDQTIARSYDRTAHFMNTLAFTAFTPGAMFSVRDLAVVEVAEGTVTTYSIPDYQDVKLVLNRQYGIPTNILDRSLEQLSRVKDIRM